MNNYVVCFEHVMITFYYFFIFTAKIDDKMQHRKVKSIAILVHSDETQFYICSMDEKVLNSCINIALIKSD